MCIDFSEKNCFNEKIFNLAFQYKLLKAQSSTSDILLYCYVFQHNDRPAGVIPLPKNIHGHRCNIKKIPPWTRIGHWCSSTGEEANIGRRQGGGNGGVMWEEHGRLMYTKS